jgi:hypothetical protein
VGYNKKTIIDCKDAFENRKLNECFPRSFYAFYILCGWRFISIICSGNIIGRVRETECKFDVQINDAFENFIDRWYFSTQLSDTWSTSDNYPTFIGRLCRLYRSIINTSEPNNSIRLLVDELSGILLSLKQSSVNKISSIRAYDRRGVIIYKNILWLWNRLSKERWDEIQKPMKRKSAQPKLEVDHTIPIAIWNRKIEEAYPCEASTDDSGNEKEFKINNITFTRSSLLSYINVIGNCSLLLRSHNRSKQDEEFGYFLQDVYTDDVKIEKIKNALIMDNDYLFPNNVSIDSIIKKIEKRTGIIKNELIEYFNNIDKNREDV